MQKSLFTAALAFLFAASVSPSAHAAEAAVVVAPDATDLERFAGAELCRYLGEIFAVTASPAEEAGGASTVFAVGLPERPAVREVWAPEGALEPQEIWIHPVPQAGGGKAVITGGSPVAVLWGVYELAERWGVRYLVHGDVLPENPGALTLPGADIRLRPNMRTRCWRLVNDLATGPVSWSLEENRRFLHQIAKMKYNRVFLSFWPSQPFVRYSFQGMEKPPATLYFGARYPIDEDTVGREKLEGMTEFTNPDFVGAASPQDLVNRAENLAHGILEQAQALGMETGIAIYPFEWPKEFMAVMPGSAPVTQLGDLTAGPGADQSMDDPLLREMAATIVRAYVETYPEAEYLHIGMPEHRGWTGRAAEAYAALTQRYGSEGLGTFEELCAKARGRSSFPGGGERVETMLKGDLASLAFFDSLMRERGLLARPGGRSPARMVYNGVVEELFPLLARMAPEGGEVLSFVDYTASRQLRQVELIRQEPPRDLPANLIFTLADDNVGVLPQLATGSLHRVMQELRAHGWSGFYTRYWTVGDLDPTVYYLARASWTDLGANAPLTPDPESACRELVAGACGPDSVTPAVQAFQIIEEITKGLDEHGLGFGFPVSGMMTKHYDAGGLSDAIKADREQYAEALSLMTAARDACAANGRRFADYHVGRLTFATKYLDAAQHFGETAAAEKAGDIQLATDHIAQACEEIRAAIQAWADVARDHGDLGAVALLNEYAYRPIRDKRAQLEEMAKRPAAGFAPPDYSKYPAGLAGYTGINLQEIACWSRQPAVRARIGERGLYKTGLTRLANGDVLACPCYQADDGKWRITVFRSSDAGETWQRIETAGSELLGKEPAILALTDGVVLQISSHPHGFRVSRSGDGGVTWKTFPIGETTEEATFGPGYSMIRDVLTSPDGTLTLLMSRGVYYDPAAPPSQAWLYTSQDGGATWAEALAVKAWDSPSPMFDEASLVRLPNGNLLACSRLSGDHPRSGASPPRGTPTPGGDESGDHMVLWESADNGLTWEGPRDFLAYSEVHGHLLVLKDERILCSYASYHLPFGVYAILSEDNGKTWDFGHPIMLALSMNCYTGWPVSIQLADGQILTAYAVTGYLEGEGASLMRPGKGDTVAESVRWALPPATTR